MKIVYCIHGTFNSGGMEKIIINKANYLVEKGFEVFIITTEQKKRKSFFKINDNIKCYDLDINYEDENNTSFLKKFISFQRKQKLHKERLEKILNKIKADIVISTFGNEVNFLYAIKDGSKKLLEFHFCKKHKRKMADAFNFPLLTKLAYYIRCWQEENIIIPKYDQFVVLTEEDKTDWLKKVPTVKCISNILPFETKEQAILKNKVVIAVGRLDAQKGFDRLITLWGKIHAKHPDWKLNIFGQGKDEQKLKNQITTMKLDNVVTIHKPCTNIKEEYLKSSIFVMTSVYEGLPMTLLEATGLGLPSVCYDFKCGPNDVIINGENGFLIKEGNQTAFVNAICRIIEDEPLRKRMGAKAKALSVRFSKENIIQKWIKLFNKTRNDL